MSDYARGHEAGYRARAAKDNQSSCACVIEDGETVKRACGAHAEWLRQKLAAEREKWAKWHDEMAKRWRQSQDAAHRGEGGDIYAGKCRLAEAQHKISATALREQTE